MEARKKFVSLPYAFCQAAERVGGKFLPCDWLRRKRAQIEREKRWRKMFPENSQFL
jgi:hypothetical protein